MATSCQRWLFLIMMILLDPDLSRETAIAWPRPMRVPSTRTMGHFLRTAQPAVKLRGEVTVLLTTDAAIRKLNHQFRGKNQATDVLSFSALQMGHAAAEEIAGDLAISVDRARRQATEQGHALSVEIKVLILHGLLHLAGFDHESDTGQMARREQSLRAQLGLPEGLIERTKSKVAPAKKPTGKVTATKSTQIKSTQIKTTPTKARLVKAGPVKASQPSVKA